MTLAMQKNQSIMSNETKRKMIVDTTPISNVQLKVSRHHENSDELRIFDDSEVKPQASFATKDDQSEEKEEEQPPESAFESRKKKGHKKMGKYDKKMSNSVFEMSSLAK